MHVIRKDGNEITLSEEQIVLELFKGRKCPIPYTHEELNNIDGTLELSVKVNNADEDVSTKYILTFFDNQCEGVYREVYMDCDTADSTRWRVLRKFCDYRLEEIEEELIAILGTDYTDYKTHAIIVSYNDLDVYVRRWKCASRAAALTGKDHLYADALWFDADEELHSQLNMLWMFAAVKFGTFSGSPKSWRIDELDKFELWCDEITYLCRIRKSEIEFTK